MVKVTRKIKEVAGAVDNISKFKKLNKRQASYIEYDKFARSNLREGYFCYNCIYWINIEGGKCMIVEDEGADVMGKVSDVIDFHMGVVQDMKQIMIRYLILEMKVRERRS